MKKLLLFLFLGINATIYAQEISGYITDNQNNPLPNVDVFIEDLKIGTSTNEDGYYILKNLPTTTVDITFSFLGYKTVYKSVEITGDTISLDVSLEESIFNMDEVIIATPFQKLQSENVMKVEKASIAQLQSTGATTLVEGMNIIPGVETVSTGIGIGKPVVRGLRGNRVLVYTQGIRLENQQFGDEHGLGIDENSVESLEVIKGPASLLYGSDALGGVLYFNPIKFANTNEFDANISETYFSNTNGSKTTLNLKKSWEQWKFLATGMYNTHSDYRIPNGDRVTNTRFNELNFNAAVGYSNRLLTSELRYSKSTSEVGITEGIEEDHQETTKEPEIPYQDLDTDLVSLNTTFFLGDSKLRTVFGYTVNNRLEFEDHDEHGHEEEGHEEEEEHHEEEHGDEEAALDMKLRTVSYDIKWEMPKRGNWETVFGIQGNNQKNSNYGEEILIPDATTNDFGALATTLYTKGKHSFQAGIRFDNRNVDTEFHEIEHGHHDEHEEEGHMEEEEEEHEEEHNFEAISKSFSNFSASVGYKTVLGRAVTTRINLASGFKAPTLAELTSNGVHHGTNRFEIGNSELDSERNVQADISFEYQSRHFEVYANGFYNSINNYIFVTPTGEVEDDFDVFEYVQDDAKLYGGEFGLHLHPHPADWLHFYSNFEVVIGEQDNGDYLPLIPANKWTNTIRTDFNDTRVLKNPYLNLSLESTFAQNKVSMFETPTAAYDLVNFGIGTSFAFRTFSMDLNVNVNNLFDKEYIAHLSRLKNDGIQNMGRNFVTRVAFNF